MLVLKNHVVPMLPHEPNRKRKNNTPRGLAAHSTPIILTIFLKPRVQIALIEIAGFMDSHLPPSESSYLTVPQSMQYGFRLPLT